MKWFTRATTAWDRARGGRALAGLAIVAELSTGLLAATITVSNTSDSGAGSLRRAIQNAAASDTIKFSVAGTITLTSGELLITKSLSIVGPGASSLAVSGHNNSRVFEISSNVTVSISGLTIRDGHAPDGAVLGAAGANGGGIYNAGTLTLTGCTVMSNTAGGGFSLKSQPMSPNTMAAGGAGGHGGGIYNSGTLRLSSCTVNGNTGGAGGRSWNSFYINNIGGAGGLGGGLYNAGTSSLTHCTLSSNKGGAGGVGGGFLRLSGPGHMMPGGTGGAGGGAYNAGALTLIACTVGGNSGGAGGTGGSGGETGGVGGAGGSGGAICNATNATTATLRNSLAALNQAGAGGAGGTAATVTGTPGAPGSSGTGPDLYGAFASQGHNLVGQADGSSGLTNGVNSDLAGSTVAPLSANLGPLQNNGGPTLTMALVAGSPALDAGDDSLLGAPFNLTTDQRGLPRKSGTHVDIGAFEAQVGALAAQTPGRILLRLQSPTQPFRLTVEVEPGTTGRIQGSSDLQNWITLTNFLSAPSGTFEFTDDSASSHPQRFYRAVRP